MDVLLFRALSLLGLAILVALAARRLRLPYTVGLVLAGAALAATRSHAGLALTHDLIFDVVCRLSCSRRRSTCAGAI
jgi:CPA1 family monovalent cation:H+ antiporter